MEIDLNKIFESIDSKAIAKIFSAEKFFTDEIIGNPILNKHGLHLFRVIMAHHLTNLRRQKLKLDVHPNYQKFNEDGILVINDFYQDFKELKEEIASFNTNYIKITPSMKAHKFVLDNKLQSLLQMAAASLDVLDVAWYQTIYPKKEDEQTIIHSDSFQPIIKYWLLLNDVDSSNCPFMYEIGSHKLSYERLTLEYECSIQAHKSSIKGTKEGSFRLTSNNVKPIFGKENTLILANTFGLHARGTGIKHRKTIFGEARINAFSPI